MSGLGGAIALLALTALGVWVLGPFVLRLGGGLLLLYGLLQLATAGSWVVPVVVGFLTIGAGEALADFKRRSARVGELDELCPDTGKVKFASEHDAQQEIERNQDLYDRGLENRYRLERAYPCEFCGWWHVTSQA